MTISQAAIAGRLTVNIAEQTKAAAAYQSRLSAFSVTGRSPTVNALRPGKSGDGYQSKLSAFGNGPTPPRRRGSNQRH